jgi:hypothetical protein
MTIPIREKVRYDDQSRRVFGGDQSGRVLEYDDQSGRVSGYDDNQSGEILHLTANQETFREKLTIKNMDTNLKFSAMNNGSRSGSEICYLLVLDLQ